ncbi:MAG: hypothetical protein WC374_06790 [Phycisphaerae bacterium]
MKNSRQRKLSGKSNAFNSLLQDPHVCRPWKDYAMDSIRELLGREPQADEWKILRLVWTLGFGDGMISSRAAS